MLGFVTLTHTAVAKKKKGTLGHSCGLGSQNGTPKTVWLVTYQAMQDIFESEVVCSSDTKNAGTAQIVPS